MATHCNVATQVHYRPVHDQYTFLSQNLILQEGMHNITNQYKLLQTVQTDAIEMASVFLLTVYLHFSFLECLLKSFLSLFNIFKDIFYYFFPNELIII
jgi:hypothetical protein